MEVMLDVSELPPPEPLGPILDALDGLTEGDWLCALLPREPQPLYRILRNLGYSWRVKRSGPTCCELLIWPENQQPPPSDGG